MRRRTWLVVALLCGALGLPLVPSASAAGLPLENPPCGSTITHSFRLSSDRTCTGDGYSVTKPNITIDLNGKTLRGDGDVSDVGIAVNGGSQQVVRNGVVRAFGAGIRTELGTSRVVIDNVVAVDNAARGILLQGKSHTVKKSTAVANDEGLGIVFGRHTIRGSFFVNNAGDGLSVAAGGSTLEKNQIARNGERGLSISGDGNAVIGNTVSANGFLGGSRVGILVTGERNVFEKNVLFGNHDDGYRDTGVNNTVSKNTAQANGLGAVDGFGTGIDATAATTPKGSANRSLGNDASTACVPSALCSGYKVDEDLPVAVPSCGETILTSFRLGADMSCTGTALIVGADDVTIDLGGHTISGDGDVNDHGVKNTTFGIGNNFTLRNGVIRNFDDGVVSGQSGGLITNVVAIGNDTGFHVRELVVTRTTAVNNSGTGYFVTGTGSRLVEIRAANNMTGLRTSNQAVGTIVKKAVLTRNHTSLAFSGSGETVRASKVLGSGTVGAGLGLSLGSLADGSTVETTSIVGNQGLGLFDEGEGNRLVDNRALANGYFNGVGDEDKSGIDATGDPTVKGKGNVSRGNDAADQCDPDFLCA